MTGLPLIDERPGTDSTSRPDDTSRAAPCQGGAACVACSADDAEQALDGRSRSPVTRPLAALLLGLVAVAPAAAQAPDDATRLEPVVVTVTRMEQKADEAPASVTVLTRDDIEHSASQTVDDLLRQVPGFSLFRRSSSLVTHPTTQGLPLRGSIDIEADSNHSTFNGRVELLATRDASVFVSGNYFYEARNNGTPLQINHTESGAGAIGARLGTPDEGEWRLVAFADTQKFRSTFSTQAADRNSETLALDQRVPTTSAGGGLQWSHRFGANLLSAGGDARWVIGETDERVYNAGAFARTRDAGGQQFIAGVFVQDVFTPIPSLEIVGGIRGDYWYSYDATRHDTPPAAGVPAEQTFNDIERIIPSGRVALLYHATPTTDLRASAYQSFRVPTLNEQYRVFRVRNDVTVANESLRPEQLTGGELGVQQRWGPLLGRITGYWNEVHDLVANVTLTSRLPDCPVGTTCRQPQNLDLARIP